MKKLIVMMLAITAIATVYAQEQDQDGKFEFFKGSKITGVIADGPINIQLYEDPNNTGIFSQIEDISASMTNEGYVRIKVGNDVTKSFKSKVTVKIGVSSLKYIRLSGNTAVIAKGKFMRSDDVTISMEGSSASIEYLDLVSKDVKIDAAGVTKLEEFTVDTEKLKITATSTGPKVVVNGKADYCTIETSGAGKPVINMINCPVREMDAKVGAFSSVKVNITGKAYVKVAGSASFRYMGTGVVDGEGNFKPL